MVRPRPAIAALSGLIDARHVADGVATLGGAVAAGYGAYLLLVGAVLRLELPDGTALSTTVPTIQGFVAVGAGALAVVGVVARREAAVWLGAGGTTFFVVSSLSTVGPPLAPVAAALLVAAAARMADPVRRRVALGIVLGVVGLAAAFVVAITVPRPVLYPIGYSVIDDRTLRIVVTTGDPIPCDIRRVDESATDVRVFAECSQPILSIGSEAILLEHPFTVRLERPLGERAVLDGNGTPAEPCPSSPCDARGL